MRHYKRNIARTSNIEKRGELAVKELELAEHYLATGEGGYHQCFRPLFNDKDNCLPHPDWVRNVFIPIRQRIIKRCEDAKESRNIKEHERIKEILRSDDFKRSMIEKYKQEQQQFKDLIKVNYPDHADHDQTEGNWNYFDAMFVSVDMNCSCGQNLIITREMTNERDDSK